MPLRARVPALLINLRFAPRPGFPPPVNPEPLVRITPNVILDYGGKRLCQAPYVLFLIIRTLETKRLINLQEKTPALFLPWREDRQHVRARAHCQLRQHEGRSEEHTSELQSR